MNEYDLKRIIFEYTEPKISFDEVQSESSFKDDLGLCSYDMMMIIAMAEKSSDTKVNVVRLLQNPTIGGFLQSLETIEERR